MYFDAIPAVPLIAQAQVILLPRSATSAIPSPIHVSSRPNNGTAHQIDGYKE